MRLTLKIQITEIPKNTSAKFYKDLKVGDVITITTAFAKVHQAPRVTMVVESTRDYRSDYMTNVMNMISKFKYTEYVGCPPKGFCSDCNCDLYEEDDA